MILTSLAPLIAGVVRDNQIVTPVGRVYCGFTGKVRLDRPGLPVLDLGGCSDGPDVLAAAYFAAVGGSAVAS